MFSVRTAEPDEQEEQTSRHPRATEGVPLEPGTKTSINANDGKELLLVGRCSTSPVPPQVALALRLGKVHLRLGDLPPDLTATKQRISNQQVRRSGEAIQENLGRETRNYVHPRFLSLSSTDSALGSC